MNRCLVLHLTPAECGSMLSDNTIELDGMDLQSQLFEVSKYYCFQLVFAPK
jgi:hypothetical protein